SGLFIQLTTIESAVDSESVPQAMFSPATHLVFGGAYSKRRMRSSKSSPLLESCEKKALSTMSCECSSAADWSTGLAVSAPSPCWLRWMLIRQRVAASTWGRLEALGCRSEPGQAGSAAADAG